MHDTYKTINHFAVDNDNGFTGIERSPPKPSGRIGSDCGSATR